MLNFSWIELAVNKQYKQGNLYTKRNAQKKIFCSQLEIDSNKEAPNQRSNDRREIVADDGGRMEILWVEVRKQEESNFRPDK